MKISSNLSERVHHLVEQRTISWNVNRDHSHSQYFADSLCSCIYYRGGTKGGFFFFLPASKTCFSQSRDILGRKSFGEWRLCRVTLDCSRLHLCSDRCVSRLLLSVWCRATQGFWGDSEPADNQTCTGQIHINHSFRGTKSRLLMVHPEKQKMNIYNIVRPVFLFNVISVTSCLIKLWLTGKLSSSWHQTGNICLFHSAEIWILGDFPLKVRRVCADSLQPELRHYKDSASDVVAEHMKHG